MQKEVNKFLKKINVEKLKNNHKECIELYNIVGGLYSDIGSYDEAIHYHEQALEICKTIGDRLSTASTWRYIGEAKAALGNFFQAIEYIKKYLDLAQRINNKVEVQRAWTTLGRVYLMQAQELKDQSNVIDNSIKTAAKEAEKKFQTALNLAESVRDQVDEKEFAQMRSGLLINIGLVNDICGQHSESIVRINKAIEICRAAKLKEDLYRCQIILTTIFRQRNNVKMATKVSDEALNTAKSIGRKILICDAFIEKGLVKMIQRDFKGAKRCFAQAYLEKSPNEEDQSKAIRLTKISHLIVINHEKLSKDNLPSDSRLRICDKLGDLFVAINCYKLAIEFYKRAFADAKLCGKPKTELARILYSIAETYADDGQFEHALVCYEKELTYRNGNDSEQCQSLIKVAHMHEYLDRDQTKVADAYEKALDKAGKNTKLMYNVLKDYVAFMQKKSFNLHRARELENVLLNLKSYPEVMEEIENEDGQEANDIEDEVANVDDIITDDEGNDEVLMIGRKRSRGSNKFKPNEVGDTPLHEACIKGDFKRVKSLISQGHEVNPRDNAGWIPLHEACNHGHLNIAEYLIEHGADVCNRGLKGMSPLHDAATNGHFDIMRLLMRNGANVIALTDTGETVLSCLRDYKKRNYTEMTNQEMSEYKLMETELLNAMDKSGFNLMEQNVKSTSHKMKPSVASEALREVRPKPRNIMNTIDREDTTEPVKDYRHAMGVLKRKRIPEERMQESPQKADLPATFHTGMNTSVQTKEWLIDDVSKSKRIMRGRQQIYDILESSSEDEDLDPIQERATCSRNSSEVKETNKDKRPTVSKRLLLDSDDEEDNFHPPERTNIASEEPNNQDDVMLIEERFPDSPSYQISSKNSRQMSPVSEPWSSMSPSTNMSNNAKKFDLFNQPLIVSIEDKRILVPMKDNTTSIKSLKDMIVDRYSVIVKAKPNISLAPVDQPDCLFFDSDLCIDVITSAHLVATIESWCIKSVENSYLDFCSNEKIEPFTFVKLETRRIDNENQQELDLSFTRFPRNHMKALVNSLAFRGFTSANLCASSCLFEFQKLGLDMIECISTWKSLEKLSLKCVGLTRLQFESICENVKLPKLKSLDLSVNTISYKCKIEFTERIQQLLQGCPKLKRLDMRRNNMTFVGSLIIESGKSGSSLEVDKEEGDNSESFNLANLLCLDGIRKEQRLGADSSLAQSFHLLASQQNQYTVYSTM